MTEHMIPNGVIVAENDGQMRGVIRSVLMHAQQEVFPVFDGMEALELARQFKPRLILLDIVMPRLNGLEACKAIRDLPGYSDVPVVMLTGYTDARLVQSAQRLGASDFITKPFRPSSLLVRLACYLDIPAHMLPAGAGSPAMVWKKAEISAGEELDNPELAKGRDVMRILGAAARRH